MPFKVVKKGDTFIAIEVTAKTVNSLFRDAAIAVTNIITTEKIRPKITKKVGIVGEELDKLLYDFISEVLEMKDSEELLFSGCSVRIKGIRVEKARRHELFATLHGASIHGARAGKKIKIEKNVKSVSGLTVKKDKQGTWKAKLTVETL